MNHLKLLSIVSLCFFAYNVQAATLIPGTFVPLPGTTAAADPSLAGPIVQDVLTPFSFSAYGGTVSGDVENRVVLGADGTYDFYWRIFNNANSAGPIQDLRLGNFITGTYNANYRVDGLGDIAPTQALLFGSPPYSPGYVNFNFSSLTGGTSGVGPGLSSMFFFLDTNATSYGRVAVYDLTNIGQTQISSQYATFAPSSPVPEPQGYAMLLAGLGLIAFTVYRRKDQTA